ncbi:MAG TPA: anthranilate synthase family protein [Streptosporangiaceae bacterium]
MSAPERTDLLARILERDPPAFALLHRPDSGSAGVLDLLAGDVSTPATLADIPLEDRPGGGGAHERRARRGSAHEVLVVIPYRQIAERGFAAPDDGTPLLALTIMEQERLPAAEVLSRVPATATTLADRRFDTDDDAYAQTVRRTVAEEIGAGEGANFVIKRSFTANISGYSVRSAMSFFCRLLERERGAYWTFIIHTGRRTLVGASPERHITLNDGTAVMNPISGTYRYPTGGPTLQGVTEFLTDPKETDELYMVLDEELKMMARVCEADGRITGPHLKEMAKLAHTEYFIEGRTNRDVRDALRETMFAPTVTGSPVESAARVISRYEPHGRGYYSGVAGLIGIDANGERTLDSAILIRTADIDQDGGIEIGVGATLVRHSDPEAEVAETRAKAAGLLNALRPSSEGTTNGAGPGRRFATHPDVQAALRHRNAEIASFWLRGDEEQAMRASALAGRSVLVIDAEDTFTAMLGSQLRSLGLAVTIRRFDEPYTLDGHDLIVMGPGPGDPRASADPKMAHLHAAIDGLLADRRPFVAVCLSHQMLSLRLGLELARREIPNQGVQRQIGFFGARERVGFYNTFAARSEEDKRVVDGVGQVEICRDPQTGEVHALRGPCFASMQFHAESVLTVNGPRILTEAALGALGAPPGAPGAPQGALGLCTRTPW